EDLDELGHAAVADVERAVQVEHARVTFRIDVELRDVLAAARDRGVRVVRVDRRHDADADAVPLREHARDDRHLFVVPAELVFQAEAAHRAEVAFDVGAEHLLELFPQVAGEEVQGLLEHRTTFDRVEGIARLQPTLQPLARLALARADRAHQIEHLTALLALQRRGVEVAHDLRDRLLDPEELLAEEAIGLQRLILVEALHARIVRVVNVERPHLYDDVVDPRVRELRQRRVLTDAFEILEEGAAPRLLLADGAIILDQ